MVARLAWLVATLVLGVGAAQAGTLEQVRERGNITCVVSAGMPGLSETGSAGAWSGLFPDFCRAVAAAVFADPARVQFVPITENERLAALRAGEIDILAHPGAWSFSNDTQPGARFVGALYYEGFGLMVPQRLGVATALELSGADICAVEGAPEALHIADYFRRNDMPYRLVRFAQASDALQAYDAGRCDVFAGDIASLDAQREALASPEAHMVLGDVIGVAPLGPAVRTGDPQWARIVRWTLFALIAAEDMGLASDTIDNAAASDSALAQRFIGVDGALGKRLGLDTKWAYNVVTTVGNYRELFARNLGDESPLDRERRLNQLWREGGLLSAPTFH